MQKRRSMLRLSLITAVAATVGVMHRHAAAQNTPLTFLGTADLNLGNSADYSPNGTPGITNDLVFGATYPSAGNLSAGFVSSMSLGSINDLNTSYVVTMANNSSTGNTLTLGGTGDLGNSVSPVSTSDLVYVASGADLNIAANTSTGLTAVTLGSGNIDVVGTGIATIQGIIGGTGGLTKTGTGTLILYQADTYTGTSIANANISSGTVQIGTGTALGSASGDVTLIGAATLYCYDNVIPSYAATFSSGRTFNISSTNSTIKIGGTEAWIIAGPIVGTGVLNVAAGSGSLEDDYSTSSAQKYGNGPGIISTNVSSGTYILAYFLDLPQGICSISSGATLEELNSGGQYSANTTFNLAGGNDTIYVATANTQMKLFGVISGSGSLVKTGASTLLSEIANTYTGATNLSAGSTFSLDYDSAITSNALIMGGSAAGATFNTLGLNSAAATVSTVGNFQTSISSITTTTVLGGGNNINIGNFNSSSLSIGLGLITRAGDATLNVTLPSIGSVTATSATANYSGGQQTILGGWATVNGNSWATTTSGTLQGLATYNTSFGVSSDVDAVASISSTVSSINSLRFNTPSAVTVTLTSPLTIATGGILETSNVGGAATLITGGSLTSGNGTDLIVSQFNTTAPLTIGSAITNASSAGMVVVKTGPGTVVLTGTNSYTGGTLINAGVLGISSDAALGAVPAAAATNVTFAGSGATLQADGAVSLSATRTLLLSSVGGGTLDENSYPLTVNGAISGAYSLYVINSTGGAGGIVNLGNTANVSSSSILVLGNGLGGAAFNISGGRATNISFGSTSIAGGGDNISAGNFSGAYNFSLGSVSRVVGGTVNFTLPTTGNILTTTVNFNVSGGSQTILGGYATVNNSTWAVSGSAATAGIISGLATYDTNFDFGQNIDLTTADASSYGNSSGFVNSMRFNTSSSLNVALGGGTLTVVTGGILETASVGLNINNISGGSLNTDGGADLIFIQDNTAAPLIVSAQIVNYVSGNLSLTKAGPGALILSGTNDTYTGATNVSGGSLIIASSTALPAGTNLSIGTLATVQAANGGTGTYALSLTMLNNHGLLDLTTNAAIIHTGSTLAAVTAQVTQGYNGGRWNGTVGITSSAAAADTTHLTALGVIVNDSSGLGTELYGANGSISSIFEDSTPADGDILVKYTYYGDTDLNGEVDGTDYSRIDNAYINNQNSSNAALTGWFNGDFNYDGIINGSDYTLIDNAYNRQSAPFSALVALPTSLVAGGSSVPEPTIIGLLGIGAVALLGRRRQT